MVRIRGLVSFLLCISIVSALIGCTADKSKASTSNAEQSVYSEKGNYMEYISNLNFGKNDADTIVVSNTQSVLSDNSFDISVSSSGVYQLNFEYRCKTSEDGAISLLIDGTAPFSECNKIILPAVFADAVTTFETLDNGDEVAPEQNLYKDFVKCYAKDYIGKIEGRYNFYISEGAHEINLKSIGGEVEVKSIVFVPITGSNNYKIPENLSVTNSLIEIDAEKTVYKNSKSILPLSGTESNLNPINAFKRKLNYIGGSNWSTANSTIYWDFKVEKSGYYSISFDYRQNLIVGGCAYRELEIDGETPFEEAKRIGFDYSSKFKNYTFSDKETPYYFYLEKGNHTLSLAATPGAFAEIYYILENLTAEMSNLYLDMTMIIGETVDANRSYELFDKIPDFNKRLQNMIDTMNSIIIKLNNKTNSNTNISTLQNAIRVLNQMIKNPYSAHLYKNDFYNSYTDLSALMSTITNSALDLDRIIFSGYKTDKTVEYMSFFEKLSYNFKRIILSYTSDYVDAQNTKDADGAIELWIGWGRDQANAFMTLIQDDFVPKTGIDVNVSIANATIVQAILSGKGPDVLLNLNRTDPVNYAMRGALLNLDEFSDFNEVISRFPKNAVLPYTYNDKVYALPDTQNFFVMFVRKDICDSLNIKIPTTWDEYINTAMLLQRKNLTAYIPYTRIADSGGSNVGVGGLSLYPTLLLQNDLKLYKEDKSKSLLSNTEQVKIFSSWTDMYTKYKFLPQADFYNRFRVGTMPIGITTYTTYTTLTDAAPEIEGKWYVTHIPGTKNANGTINRSVAGSGTGCSITRLTNNKENAWKFLKWWTSADVQLRYSNRLESVLGTLGRVATSNIEALSKMDYDAETKNLLLDIMENDVVEIEEVPGGYYTARGIDQAFWATIEQNKMPIDSLVKWSKSVDDEIARKTAEYAN